MQILRRDINSYGIAQRIFLINTESDRGEIFLRDRFSEESPLAINKEFFLIYAEPNKIEDAGNAASALSEALGISKEELMQKISKHDDPYEVISQKVTKETADRVKKSGLKGVGLLSQKLRYYPYANLASQITGFVGAKDQSRVGQYGLEGFYEEKLGSGSVQKLILSIDPQVQFKIEENLKEAVEKWGADRGSVIVMEPRTGRILGMANYPDYNPNEYSKVGDISLFKNSAISDQFELGSVFKPITMAAGIQEKVVTPDTAYDDKGISSFGSWYIKNSDGKAHGIQTMTQVLEHSLNTGVVFVEQKLPKDKFKEYIKNFGFGEKTGVDLAGESAGNTKNLDTNRDVVFANVSFGQGIAVTPLQMISAISALANGGVLMKPSVVDQKIYIDGNVETARPEAVKQAVSKDTADTLTKMLVSVVENGYDKAKVPGYWVAGKTGTAQLVENGKRGYSAEDTIHTFVGYAPAYNSRFSVLIKIDKPHGVRFAAESLTPVFSNIMSYLLSYYEVPPDFIEKPKS